LTAGACRVRSADLATDAAVVDIVRDRGPWMKRPLR
jgi:hypothetical protein